MTQHFAVELAPFVIADGVSADALIAASDRLERDFLAQADGYIGRVLVQKEANQWADIVFWKSETHATRAMEAVASSAACRSYFECMKQVDHDDPASAATLFRACRLYGSLPSGR